MRPSARNAPPAGPRHAYTLVEVLVAVVVVATMTVSLFAGFSSGFALIVLGRQDQRATLILHHTVESIRLLPWSEVANCPGTSFTRDFDPDPSQPGTKPLYLVQITTTNSPAFIPDSAAYKQQLRLVTVSVSWTNSNRGQPIVISRQMQALVASSGANRRPWGLGQ